MRSFIYVLISTLLIPALGFAGPQDLQESSTAYHTICWSEDWESGTGLWNASNGVWEIGVPTYGTTKCFGLQCAATNLDGQYPAGTSSRLESPPIDLPGSPEDGVLWLGFWHWFNNSRNYGVDYGVVQIWTESSGWTNATGQYVGYSVVWTPYYVDLTEYIGQTIKIGFLFADVQGGASYQGPGWYVDNIRIFDGNFPELETVNRFEKYSYEYYQPVTGGKDMDWDGWYPNSGVWELGEPVSGISKAHSTKQCFGTNLNGNYPTATFSRLISPYTTLPASPLDGKLYLSFKQYCSFSNSYGTDQGLVQINDGSGWDTLATLNWRNNLGGQWTERTYDISEYAGGRVRFGFVIDDNESGASYESYGWYIDDLQFSEGEKYIGNPERFENYSPNWYSTYGNWEVGMPKAGPSAAYSEPNCWGTNLDGNYPAGASDILYTPPISLPGTGDLYLRFMHWYSFSSSYGTDYGVVMIKPEGGNWTELSTHYTLSSDWTQSALSLSAYAGQTVQIGFKLVDIQSGASYQSTGWYMDDFEIIGMPQAEVPSPPIWFDVAINAGPAELTFPHVTSDKVVIYGSPVDEFLPTLGTRLAVLPGSAQSYSDTDHSGWPAIYYRVSIVDNLGNESVPMLPTIRTDVSEENKTPAGKLLEVTGAVPNPFNPTTFIHFNLLSAGMVDIQIFDVNGRKVVDLWRGRLEAGPNRVRFSANGLASGVYFVRVSAGVQTQTKKIVLLK